MNKMYILLDDKKREGNGLRTYYEDKPEYFTKMNKEGWGVFFAVNDFDATPEELQALNEKLNKTTATKRNIPFLKALNYAYADLDIAKEGDGMAREKKEELKHELLERINEKLTPSMVIATSNGLQALWKLKPCGIDTDTQARYTNIIEGIIEWSKTMGAKGDQVKDTTRILREPGYNHMKEEPYLVEVVQEEAVEYSLEELEKVFPHTPAKKYIAPTQPQSGGIVQDEVNRIPFQDVIVRAFKAIGRVASFDKQDRLVLDGRLTGTFQGKNGDRDYLASTSHEPYKGNRTTAVADIMSCTTKEAYKWIIQEFNIKLTPLLEMKNQEQEKIIKTERKYKPYTWGTPVLDTKFWAIKRGHYVVIWGEENSGKTTYAFDIAKKNAELGHKVLFMVLESTVEEIYDIRCLEYAGYTAEEDRLEQYPPEKKLKYNQRMKELKDIKNLEMFGFPQGEEATIENVLKVVDEKKPDIVFIDNMGQVVETYGQTEPFKHISRSCMNYSKNSSIPVCMIHHARKRQGGTRTRLRNLDELRETGKIKDDAYYIVQVSRAREQTDGDLSDFDTDTEPMSDFEKSKTLVYQQKNRRKGEGNIVQIYFQDGTFNDTFNFNKK